jgi:uncharacterized phage protein (TIGR02220 family)
MSRINIEDSLETDPRFIYCKNKLGRFVAIGAFVEVARVAQRYWVKGEIIPEKIYTILEFPKEFIESGLVSKTENGYYLAGSEEQFKWIVAKTENGKKGGRPPTINKITKATDNLHETYANLDESYRNPPTPTPTPTQKKKSDANSASAEFDVVAFSVIEYLNKKTGAKFEKSKSSMQPIIARLKSGHTVNILHRVIDSKCDEWLFDVKMKRYLRPTTLFSEGNLDTYIAQLDIPATSKKEKAESDFFGYLDQKLLEAESASQNNKS